jgi:hypothetical protein
MIFTWSKNSIEIIEVKATQQYKLYIHIRVNIYAKEQN